MLPIGFYLYFKQNGEDSLSQAHKPVGHSFRGLQASTPNETLDFEKKMQVGH